LIGGLSGSWLVGNLPKTYYGVSVLLIISLISAVARFLVPLIFLSKLEEVKIKKNIDEKKLFIDLVISKPLNSAMNQTSQIMFLTEESIKRVRNTTRKGFNIVKEPLNPVISEVVNSIDKGLTHVEPLRKALTPKRLKHRRKRDYEDLTEHNYSKYVKSDPKISKEIYRKHRVIIKKK
jgi:hypothetical protein